MSDYMMDFTGDDLESGKERQAVPEGEYRVRIKDWKSDDDGKINLLDKNGNSYIMPILEVIDCEEAEYSKDFTYYLPRVNDDMDAKQKSDARFKMREFWTAFEVDYTRPFDPESVIGSTADALLNVKEDTGYGEQNNVKRFIVSH